MSVETVKVPDLGGAENVEVIEIPVSAGDKVAEEDTLVVLESDKASMDVPSPLAGVIKKVLVKLGDTVSRDTPIAEVEQASDAGSDENGKSTKEEKEPEPEGETAADAEQPEQDRGDAEDTGDAAGEKPADDDKAEAEPEPEPTQEPEEQPLQLPDLGTDDEVDVIELSVAVGDEVEEGDPLMTLEGDKATMDVPSPAAGKITAFSVKEGDKVKSGQDIGRIESAGKPAAAEAEKSAPGAAGPEGAESETESEKEAPPPADEKREKAEKPAEEPAAENLDEPEAPPSEVYAGPMVRQFARELGVDLRNVEGTGLKGRIQKEDVENYVKTALRQMESGGVAGTAGGGIPGIPDRDFAKFGEVEEKPLNKVARLTATNMHRVWLNAPMVTQFDDADITDLEGFRKSLKPEAEKRGVKLTPVAFLMKACAAVLADNPVINRSWHSSGEKVIQKHYFHIGMAVDTPRGLMVPVIRDLDRKGVFEIAADIAAMAEKAREGKLSTSDMEGGCFSISSLGAIGGRGFTPIVNAPEAAILGVSKASIQPVWDGDEFVPRQLLPLSLSYDHRVVNGADAGRFLTQLVEVLGDMRRLLL